MPLISDYEVDVFGTDLDKTIMTEDELLACDVRMIDQDMVETNLFMYINGECHGQRVLQHDLRFQINGKKIIKSVQARLVEYKRLVAESAFAKCV